MTTTSKEKRLANTDIIYTLWYWWYWNTSA